MRIALVTETYQPETNGVATTLGRLVAHLAERGHQIDLVTPTASSNGQTGNVRLLTLPGLPVPGYHEVRFGLPAVRRLMRHWRDHRPDIIYVATQGPLGWAALRAARRLGLPVISGYHTHFTSYGEHYGLSLAAPLVAGYLRRFHSRTAITLAPTQLLADSLEEAGYGRVAVLSRGVDTTLFSPEKRSRALRSCWGVMPGTPVVLYVGRIAPEKNLQLAIRSFRAIQRATPQARFVVVGDGPLREQLQADNPDFVFTGILTGEALAEHYASADLFLFPSLTDTYGNVVMEAMASGLPVVAFDTGAAAEHIAPFKQGLLAPFGHADRFVALTILMSRELRLRQRFGAFARCAMARQGWDRICTQFEAILQDHAIDSPRHDRAPALARTG